MSDIKQQKDLVDKLAKFYSLEKEEWRTLLTDPEQEIRDYVSEIAVAIRKQYYGNEVYVRGLIEFTNYCRNDCYYCGIRRSNPNAERYHLSKEEIMSCCKIGYELGFRTFVLQGGEDAYYTDERMVEIIHAIKEAYPDCAITLSLGERSRESYQELFNAGADRYLLRHETASETHYNKLHPSSMSFHNRLRCLQDLKEIGYQVGCGFMVGSPHQTIDCLIEDMQFLSEFKPAMVGIGPFIPHHDTPMSDQSAGTLGLTCYLLGLIRIMLPYVLLPSTTALGTIHPKGRELGILSGANVVMPNLSPVEVRNKYLLYDDKICTGDEAAECKHCLAKRMESIGYEVVVSRGDVKCIK